MSAIREELQGIDPVEEVLGEFYEYHVGYREDEEGDPTGPKCPVYRQLLTSPGLLRLSGQKS